MSYGKKNMFKHIKNEEKRDRLLRNYFEYQNYVSEGVLFTQCYHLLNLKTYLRNKESLDFAKLQLDKQYEDFLTPEKKKRKRRQNQFTKDESEGETDLGEKIGVKFETTLNKS